MNVTCIEIDLMPGQIDQLRYPQPVPVTYQNQGRVEMSQVPFEGSFDHSFHFLLKQILPIPNLQIRPDIAGNFFEVGNQTYQDLTHGTATA